MILNYLFFCLIFSIQATIDINDLKANVVSKFSNEQEAQESVDLSVCIKSLENEEYLKEIMKLLEDDYPEDYDLSEIALFVCQNLIQTERLRTKTRPLTIMATEGKLNLYSKKKLDTKLVLMPEEREIEFRSEPRLYGKLRDWWDRTKAKIKEVLQRIEEFIDTVIDAAEKLFGIQ